MNLRVRAMEGALVAAVVVLMTGIAQTAPKVTEADDAMLARETVTVETDLATSGTAGIVVSMNQIEADALQQIDEASISISPLQTILVASADQIEEAIPEEPVLTEEEMEWQNRLMADVNEFLYVRASADENAEIVGKLYKGDVAEIIESGESWTHVVSGNVDGYVNNGYCITGQDALAYAEESFDSEAEIMTNGLRIRSEASEDASIVTVVSEGTTLKVASDAETADGWVPVVYGGSTRYVSADHVEVELALGEGITIEEEQEELARIAAEEAAKKAAQITEVTTVQNDAIAASVDEVTLLAGIIQCEAGNECYEGQVAVGAVVMNRVRSGRYPGTISEVIYQRGQFTPAGSGGLAKVLERGPKDSCIQAAQEALNGTDNTGGALSFRRASSGHAGVVIGNHVFY